MLDEWECPFCDHVDFRPSKFCANCGRAFDAPWWRKTWGWILAGVVIIVIVFLLGSPYGPIQDGESFQEGELFKLHVSDPCKKYHDIAAYASKLNKDQSAVYIAMKCDELYSDEERWVCGRCCLKILDSNILDRWN